VLRRVGFWEALADPIVLEHQIGALAVVLLVWLAWRDKRPPQHQPLGYALAVFLIVGSLMLLGHAHSNVREDEQVANLINVQHAAFGACGLFAGTLRWLMLRGLIPAAGARLAWPLMIVALGVLMTFGYREAV
jgi:hypothetical protein